MKSKSILVLRTCRPDMTSYKGFQWPHQGPVSAPDWDPTPQCGQGLHGLAWGQGSAELLDWGDAVWVVVEVKAVVELHDGGTDKVKFPRGTVVYAGDRLGATALILSRAPAGTVCHGATVVAGAGGTATAGDHGTATAGEYGTATAGDHGTATAGERGTATAGYHGTATAGYHGTATAGDHGTATAGYHGTATAGDCGEIRIRYWDGRDGRYRVAIGYVGEGIEANTAYVVRDGRLVKA